MQKGIDVSYCQKGMSIPADTAMTVIKAGQGGYLTGEVLPFRDPELETFTGECIKKKLPMGFYWFFVGTTKKDTEKNAKAFLQAVKPYCSYSPFLYLDYECYGIPGMENLDRKTATDNVLLFLDILRRAGYLAALYTNPDHLEYRLEKARIVGKYPLWLADWTGGADYDGILMRQVGVENIGGYDCDRNECYFPGAVLPLCRLALKGFVDSPVYWIEAANRYPNLHHLFRKADARYRFRWKQSKKTEYALQKLQDDGVISAPSYWRDLAQKDKNIKTLLLKLGGGVI